MTTRLPAHRIPNAPASVLMVACLCGCWHRFQPATSSRGGAMCAELVGAVLDIRPEPFRPAWSGSSVVHPRRRITAAYARAMAIAG